MRRSRIIKSRFPSGVMVIVPSLTPATTWSTTDYWIQSGGLISFPDNLTILIGINADSFAGRAVDPLGTDKYYWETTLTTITGVGGEDFEQGVTDGTALSVLANRLVGSNVSPTHGAIVNQNSVFLCLDSVDHATTVFSTTTHVDGVTIDTAFNGTTNKIWFRKNNGAWNEAMSNQDPAGNGGAGLGGLTVTMAGAGPYFATWGIAANPGNTFTSRFARASWLNSCPAGFDQINAGA